MQDWPPIYLAAIYEGYFEAGVGVMMLAVLELALEDSLTRLNALKQALSFVINVAAAAFFRFSGKALWTAAAVMAACSEAAWRAGSNRSSCAGSRSSSA